MRPQPRFGTVEVRILDAQTTVAETAALAALIQCIARLEVEEGYVSERLVATQEALDENRFLAARDGMEAELIDPDTERRVPARELLAACWRPARPTHRTCRCEPELEPVAAMGRHTGARRQLDATRGPSRLRGMVEQLADAFCVEGYARADAPPGSLAPAGPGRSD